MGIYTCIIYIFCIELWIFSILIYIGYGILFPEKCIRCVLSNAKRIDTSVSLLEAISSYNQLPIRSRISEILT